MKSNRRPCKKCGDIHYSQTDVCWHCRRAEHVAKRVTHCAWCGGKVPAEGRLGSRYCSVGCAARTSEIARKAISLVQMAIRRGEIQKITKGVLCADCGKQATEYEHRDYSRPLDVVAVCRGCNIRRGPADTFIAGRQSFKADGSIDAISPHTTSPATHTEDAA